MSNCGIKPGILYVTTRGSDLALQSLERQRAAGLRVDSAPPFQEHAAVWLPDEGHVNNQHLVEALYQAAADAHVAFIPERVYLSFLQSEGGAGKATRVGLSGETTCDKVLVCAGAWSGEIENQAHDCSLPVTPVMGEMLSLRHVRARDKFLIDHIIYSSDVYLVPRRDGTLLVGATMRRIGFDKRVTVRGVNTLLNAACALVPELAHFELETQWAGLRPRRQTVCRFSVKQPVWKTFIWRRDIFATAFCWRRSPASSWPTAYSTESSRREHFIFNVSPIMQ
jgi:glycine/D-amino acid oxidase-like deaminating enzyme